MSNRSMVEERKPKLVVEDRPPIGGGSFWRGAAQAATIGICLILFGAVLYFTRTITLPVVSAIVIGTMLGPLSARLTRPGIPPVLSAALLLILVMAVLYAIIALVYGPLIDWAGRSPEIFDTIKGKLQALLNEAPALQQLHKKFMTSGTGLNIDVTDFIRPALDVLTPAVGALLIFFGTLFFYLSGRIEIRRLVALIEEREDRLRALHILSDVEHHLAGYLSIVSVIYLGVGIIVGCIAYFVGLPNPPAWGAVAFALNFIPYIGPLIVLLSLLIAGLVAFPTVGHAIIAPLVFLAVSTLEGHFVTPSIVGRHLTMNPLTVFLALVFWTWLWGPLGAFLAAPLVIVGLVVARHLFPGDDPDLPG